MSNTVARICAQVGVQIVDRTERLGPGRTCALGTLEAIHREHGDGHLILLLRTFVESEGNASSIDAFALWAVSDVILGHPEWANSGLRWLEAFDRIDLCDIRRHAKASRAAVPQRHGIAAALCRELTEAFRENAGPPTELPEIPGSSDLLYGTRAIAAFLEVGLSRCREWISKGFIPTFHMPGCTTTCARRSTLNRLIASVEERSRESVAA